MTGVPNDAGPTLLTHSAAILLALHTEENGLLTSVLAERIKTLSNGVLDLSTTKVTSAYGDLVDAGYITKERAEKVVKRRGAHPNLLRLTPKGQALIARLAPLLQRGVGKS